MQRRSPILLMTGPTGSGKTITLRLLAEKHKINVEEWINPVTSSFELKKEAGATNLILFLALNMFMLELTLNLQCPTKVQIKKYITKGI